MTEGLLPQLSYARAYARAHARARLENIALIGTLLAAGLVLTASASWLSMRSSFQLWELASTANAERLSAELRYRVLRNREPLIAVSSLYSGSDDVTQEELRLARTQILQITGLSVQHSLAFVPSQIRPYQTAQVVGDLAILPEQPGRELDPRLLPAIEAALAAPGELIMGALIQAEGVSYLPIAITALNAELPGTLLYLLDFSQLLGNVTQDVVDPNSTFTLYHPSTGDLAHSSLTPLASDAEAQHTVYIDMGLYQWRLDWLFDERSDRRLTYVIALAGVLITLMLAFIIYNLLHQRQIVRQQIESKTEELATAQNLLMRREKMAALGQLVAGISHELNTPIGNGLLAATVLRSRSREFIESIAQQTAMPHSQQETIDSFLETVEDSTRLIEKNIQRASELIQSFKQVSVDQSSARRRRFNLLSTLQELRHTLAPSLRTQRLQLTLDVPNSIVMDSYPGALFQLVSNLVSNAMDHAYSEQHDSRWPYRGELLLTVTSLDKEHILLVFSDDGLGMDESVRDHAFDPFYTTRLGTGGSGLGLHIVFTLATEVLGGDIKLTEIKNGTVFQITLPVQAPERPPAR